MKKYLDAIAEVKHEPLPENPDLETVLKNEISFLKKKLNAHANAADQYRIMANAYTDKLRAAGKI